MTQERQGNTISGWLMLPVTIAAWIALAATIVAALMFKFWGLGGLGVIFVCVLGALWAFVDILLPFGFFALQPNEARVLVLFGEYRGSVKQDGFHWANPFSVHRANWISEAKSEQPGQARIVREPNKYRISLRARNFETQTLKVNDQRGNPIDIGAVIVWRVENTAQALFDMDDYAHYVKVQSETALRHLANCYPYDHGREGTAAETTLRDSTDAVSAALRQELQARLSKAGVAVDEARLTHLAYAQEIAGAMLRRQQAEAIIAARQMIVQGAVGMVEMALAELARREVLVLDDERKAAMVGNLLVVLCGERQADPVINAGTLYH